MILASSRNTISIASNVFVVFIMLLILSCGSPSAATPSAPVAILTPQARDEGAIAFEEVAVKPRFEYTCDKTSHDCFKEVLDWVVRQNFRYPEEAMRRRIDGRVYVTIGVRPNGAVRVVHVKGPDPALEQGALLALRDIPNVYPGENEEGVAVPVEYNYFIDFRIM